MSEVKRYAKRLTKSQIELSQPRTEFVLATDYDSARTTAEYWKAEHLAGNQELDAALTECERLRAIIDSALERFPFNADRQKFTFNGQEVTADGDNLFYSVKRVNAFLCEVNEALSAKP